MRQAVSPGETQETPKPAPTLTATRADPFKLQAEKRRQAEQPRKPSAMFTPAPAVDPFIAPKSPRGAGRGFTPRGPLTGAAAQMFYNPFAARPAAADQVEPPPATVRAPRVWPVKRSTRKLSNGAELSVVPAFKVTEAEFTEAHAADAKVAEGQVAELKPAKKAFQFRFGRAAAATVAATAAVATAPAIAEPPPPEPPPTPAPPPPPISASAIVPASGATGGSKGTTAPAANDTDTSYWPKRGSGGGSGGGGDRPIDRAFNQDDLMGVLIALGLLLLFAWMWLSNLGKGGDDSIAHPQLAAATVPPRKDPFGPGPVDLRPTSPMPEATPAPPPVIEPAVTPQAAAPTIPTPQASPPTAASTPTVAPMPEKPLRVYFCTARSSMTAAARKQFDKDVASWKTIVGEKEIIVTGYADTRGASEANVQLSALRADYIADALRAHGLKVTEVDGMGELAGLDDNQNCANQRRADISLAANPTPASKACAPPPEDEALACAT